ncbi:iron complex transport system ATP-binding protein [Pilibacter termitis]|uniref:Iron complex transport system ATP-binding protein n=1 Tax=Pilibacter termitis TaxID=263852 RepID=A0A1T4NSW1_9ENTE|nr:ATP-binding cassette domain-containing protein [Pilibacter termitis]SJZ81788.1 iron complex transport system ATP-binding protein [Pilibacter termitis]
MLVLKNVSKKYGQSDGIEEIHLTLRKNKMIAFIGPNGAGKSTLLSVISQFLRRDTGEIYLDEQELKTWHSKDLAKRLASMRQTNTTTLNLTVRELVSFGRFPYSKGRLTKEDKKIVVRAIKQVNLEKFAEKSILTLSGGQLQRAYIGLILAQDTPYILLDEPLNNLDMSNAKEIMTLLKKLVKEHDKTICIVLHDINFASCYADEIVAMKNGKIFDTGKTSEVIESKKLTELFGCIIPIKEINGQKFCLYF